MKNKILFVWDLHGTLEKGNVNAVHKIINLVLKNSRIDKKITLQNAIEWYGLSWLDYFRLAFPEGNQQIWEGLLKRLFSLKEKGWTVIKKHIKLRDSAKEVLELIQKQGHHNIILSNTPPQHIRTFTDLLKITQYFNGIIGVDSYSGSGTKQKNQNTKSRALRDYLKNKKYKKIILIGDSEGDVKAGKKCGAITYFFLAPEFKGYRKNKEADYLISDLRDVLKELKA